MRRRSCLGLAGACLTVGCRPGFDPAVAARYGGSWVGDAAALAHRWRDRALPAGPASPAARRAGVLVVGAGVAGLAAAWALRRSGVDDLRVLELHDRPGGNSRSHALGGRACPMGAHYLPVPGPAAHELLSWLHDIGVARQVAGRTQWDERHLCHAPAERLWIDGAWHEGLLPPLEAASPAYRQAQRLAQAVAAASRELGFAMPASRAPWTPGHADLDRQSFAAWLDALGIDAAPLRWYLDYCCLDDFGAPAAEVSAWAGLHYFASRRGFGLPGADPRDEGNEPVLTWPQGNGWLVDRLAQGLGERLLTGRLVHRVAPTRTGVEVDAWVDAEQRHERWQAAQVVLAMPLAWTARVLESPGEPLRRAAASLVQAPWLVANLELDSPVFDRPGVPPAWDNVVFGRRALGYVDAGHQHLELPRGGPVLLTAYHALPRQERAALLGLGWQAWAQRVVDELARVHPDLPARVRQVDLARHGHAMSIPYPGLRGNSELALLRDGGGLPARLHLAHADLAGYSVFEEAFTLGVAAAGRTVAALRGNARPRNRS